MKVCLISPYIPKHFGGGEKYLFDVAHTLSSKHEVSVAVPIKQSQPLAEIKQRYETFLGYSLTKVQFIYSPILDRHQDFITKLWWTHQFDLLYYATDGSLFFSLAKKNILHVQIPLKLDKSSFLEKLKLANWKVKNTNSQFTKKSIEHSWQTKINFVHYPVIDLHFPPAGRQHKEKVILHVGRFFQQLHAKRQDVLVGIFKDMCHQNPTLMAGWKLVLIGGIEDDAYATKVAQAAQGFPIQILHTVTQTQLHEWYQKASIYWHATGFGIDEQLSPERVEHFGISTVEAMAAGCLPVVIDKGGQPEILGTQLSTLLWETSQECIDITFKLIQSSQQNTLRSQAQTRASFFGKTRFEQVLWKMVQKA